MKAATASVAPEAYRLPSRKFRLNASCFLAFTVLLVVSGGLLGFNPFLIFLEFHNVSDFASRALPPNLELLITQRSAYASLLETLSMAFVGTLFGGFIALILAFLCARNTAPSPMLGNAIKAVFALERAIPSFAVMLVFQIAVGVGPFSATIALTIGSIGMFGKLFAEALESVPARPVDSISSIGATRSQTIRYGVIPAAMPSIISNWFYAFDTNVRSAIALGAYGGGGIGFQLVLAQKTLRHDDLLAWVCFILLLVAVLERVSDGLRGRLLGKGGLK